MVTLLLVVVGFGVWVWSVSLGSVLEARREAARDLDAACRAWVVLGDDGPRYRCGAPTVGDRDWCGTHAHPDRRRLDDDLAAREPVEASRAWAAARRRRRWGLPLAGVLLAASVVLAVVVLG